jgi:hypothetical protein
VAGIASLEAGVRLTSAVRVLSDNSVDSAHSVDKVGPMGAEFLSPNLPTAVESEPARNLNPPREPGN